MYVVIAERIFFDFQNYFAINTTEFFELLINEN